jgi:hypothetical protein
MGKRYIDCPTGLEREADAFTESSKAPDSQEMCPYLRERKAC